jgi:hypothetical protein
MATWAEFEAAEPQMAALGLQQLKKFGLAYLATTRRDGAPRVNPVCPVIADGRLFVATAPTSPKRLDLLRDGRYMLHMLPGKEEEEFSLRGRATRSTDAALREIVVAAGVGTVDIKPEEWLFEYDIEEAATARWENVGQPNTRAIRARWVAAK